jgi:hypothetical protein
VPDVIYHSLKHARKVSEITEGEVALYGTSDGGTTWYPVKVDSSGRLDIVSGLIPENYDYIALSYTGDNLTSVVYKTGGSGGTTVATLTLAYTGSVLDSITRT